MSLDQKPVLLTILPLMPPSQSVVCLSGAMCVFFCAAPPQFQCDVTALKSSNVATLFYYFSLMVDSHCNVSVYSAESCNFSHAIFLRFSIHFTTNYSAEFITPRPSPINLYFHMTLLFGYKILKLCSFRS